MMKSIQLILLLASQAFAATPMLPISHPYGLYVVEVRIKITTDNSCTNSPQVSEPIVMEATEYGPFRSYEDASAWAHESVWPDQIGEIRQLKVPAQVIETTAARMLPLVTLRKRP